MEEDEEDDEEEDEEDEDIIEEEDGEFNDIINQPGVQVGEDWLVAQFRANDELAKNQMNVLHTLVE